MMQKTIDNSIRFLFLLVVFFPSVIFAESADLFINTKSFSTFPTYPVEGKKVRIYITIQNTSQREDMKGVVRAYDNSEKKQIEVDQSFSTPKNTESHLFFDFTPAQKGVHEIVFRIIPWEEYADNQEMTDTWSAKVFIDSDKDGDGIGDQIDAYPDDPTKSVFPAVTALPLPTLSAQTLPDDVFSLENSRPPVVILSQMNPFSIRRGEDFLINSGPSRGFLGENLTTQWEIIDQNNKIIFTKETPELTFSISWIGEYRIRATVTNESGISAFKEIPFSVRFAWRDFFMATGLLGLSICFIWWIWQRKK